ncbi:hypothetical protein N5K27_27165 [Pigmentiphaga sp. GD03639]|uniref:tetratricopeptide repeat protein n=1 Tax=Pigmentiphaga sp. GD03639 TaxID=2975354 RepID=UPI00244AAA9D|nr:hypothetical protein [Pigmentiphaga sp. GD03639]MDH2239982.1 hypothetical protein [Pigmentiphaga sp. GD03639]
MNPGLLCDDQTLARILDAMRADSPDAREQLTNALKTWESDARLHFLLGSVMASDRDYAGAELEMIKAVGLSPETDIYRFQLGLLQLTCGSAEAARATLSPLAGFPGSQEGLKVFASGLMALLNDDMTVALDHLQRGVQLNTQHPELNHDIGLIVEKLKAALPRQDQHESGPSTHLLLSGYWDNATKH